MVRYTDKDIVQGVLIDFDLATLGEPIGERHHGRRTGTRRFMSRELLIKGTVPHFERFDWESFFYVLCWIGTHYSGGAEIDTTAFRNWDTDDDDTLGDLKLLLLLQGPSSTLFPLFSGFYQPMLVDWIMPMQRMYGAVYQKKLEHELA